MVGRRTANSGGHPARFWATLRPPADTVDISMGCASSRPQILADEPCQASLTRRKACVLHLTYRIRPCKPQLGVVSRHNSVTDGPAPHCRIRP